MEERGSGGGGSTAAITSASQAEEAVAVDSSASAELTSLGSATGNPEHYQRSMVDTLPKFDPTGDSSLAIALALNKRPAVPSRAPAEEECRSR